MTFVEPTADIIGGGVVDFADLQVLADNWLSWKFDPYYSADADYYGDGFIDWKDLEIMCENWLAAESGTDFEDFAVLANAWLHWQVNPYFNESADLNGDDRIDFEDFAVLAQYWLGNGTSGSDDYYYHFDGLGSVIALTDAAGEVVETYKYTVYGQANKISNVGNSYMFTGRSYDAETGLYYYRARYYGPSIGRFLQTDPVGYSAGINWYAYCGNNPVVLTDPLGLDYIDLNLTYTPLGSVAGAISGSVLTGSPAGTAGGIIVGGLSPTVGIMYDPETQGLNIYGGLAWSTNLIPKTDISVTHSQSNPSKGLNIAVTGSVLLTGQVGYAFGEKGGIYSEIGGSNAVGITPSVFYASKSYNVRPAVDVCRKVATQTYNTAKKAVNYLSGSSKQKKIK